ncbi:MAG: transposase [Muribaculaceae bacterium]|nr:transposase [Muribaculaceae bacterium]
MLKTMQATSNEVRRLVGRHRRGKVRRRRTSCFRINGIGNHIHLLVGLSPSIALSDLVRDIKQGSSKWAKQQDYFPNFRGWGKEYGAFSCSVRDIDSIIHYINNQRIHHNKCTFEHEYQGMIERSGLEWNEYRLT